MFTCMISVHFSSAFIHYFHSWQKSPHLISREHILLLKARGRGRAPNPLILGAEVVPFKHQQPCSCAESLSTQLNKAQGSRAVEVGWEQAMATRSDTFPAACPQCQGGTSTRAVGGQTLQGMPGGPRRLQTNK